MSPVSISLIHPDTGIRTEPQRNRHNVTDTKSLPLAAHSCGLQADMHESESGIEES